MDFHIKFQTIGYTVSNFTTDEDHFLVENQNPGGGLDLIEAAEDLTGFKNLTHHDICPPREACEYNRPFRHIKVDDFEVIKKIPQFQHNSEAVVIVPNFYFGPYVELRARPHFKELEGFFSNMVRRNKKSRDLLTYITLVYELDESKIISSWIQDGFPDYWHTSKEEVNRLVKEKEKRIYQKGNNQDNDPYGEEA